MVFPLSLPPPIHKNLYPLCYSQTSLQSSSIEYSKFLVTHFSATHIYIHIWIIPPLLYIFSQSPYHVPNVINFLNFDISNISLFLQYWVFFTAWGLIFHLCGIMRQQTVPYDLVVSPLLPYHWNVWTSSSKNIWGFPPLFLEQEILVSIVWVNNHPTYFGHYPVLYPLKNPSHTYFHIK